MIRLRDWMHMFSGEHAETYYGVEEIGKMLKLFHSNTPQEEIERIYNLSNAVESMGVPTPHAFCIDECMDDGSKCIVYERIINQKSISRMCLDNPESIPEFAKRFAQETKKLHSVKCECGQFPSRKEYLIKKFEGVKLLSKSQKNRIIAQINKASDETTCLHGKLYSGNLIYSQRESGDIPYWIDLKYFSYGDPFLDIGWLRAMTLLGNYAYVQEKVHMDKGSLEEFWDAFAEEYCGTNDPETIKAFTDKANGFSVVYIYKILRSPEKGLLDVFARKRAIRTLMKYISD